MDTPNFGMWDDVLLIFFLISFELMTSWPLLEKIDVIFTFTPAWAVYVLHFFFFPLNHTMLKRGKASSQFR